jgi:hypothetical protein
MMRVLMAAGVTALVVACTPVAEDLAAIPEPIGDFRKGFAIVVAPNVQKGPVSRDASAEEWIESVQGALDARFDRFDGNKFYHIGVSVEGYILAPPGIPILLSPKSALILNVTFWDDATQSKLNAEPHQVTVLESFTADSLIGTGYTQTKAQQMENLSQNAARAIERYMRENGELFGGETEVLDADETIITGDALAQAAAGDVGPAN